MENIWNIAVLAHNEESNIIACLDSLKAGVGDHPYRVFVLANGCTDKTEELVSRYATTKPNVTLVSIKKGDKCNAWNEYIHNVNTQADIHFFMDGDVEACPQALEEMATTMFEHPKVNAVTALPATGRSAESQIAEAKEEHGLAGNLYALRDSFVTRLKTLAVQLPTGIVGDDSLLGALIMWDLDPSQAWDKNYIALCYKAGFTFESMSPLSVNDWKVQWKRMIRYSRRRFETIMLRDILLTLGVGGLPKDNISLYQSKQALCTVNWRGIWTLFDWLALRQINRLVSKHA